MTDLPGLVSCKLGLKCSVVSDLGKFGVGKNHVEEESSEFCFQHRIVDSD